MYLYIIKRVDVVIGVIEYMYIGQELLIMVNVARVVLEHSPEDVGYFFVRGCEVGVFEEVDSVPIGSFDRFNFFPY